MTTTTTTTTTMKILESVPAADHEIENDADVTTLPPDVLASRSISLRFPKCRIC